MEVLVLFERSVFDTVRSLCLNFGRYLEASRRFNNVVHKPQERLVLQSWDPQIERRLMCLFITDGRESKGQVKTPTSEVQPSTATRVSNPSLPFRSRTVVVRLYSAAGTGYFYTTVRRRALPKLQLRKYDPIGSFENAKLALNSQR